VKANNFRIFFIMRVHVIRPFRLVGYEPLGRVRIHVAALLIPAARVICVYRDNRWLLSRWV
jgi:hypothetical protein